MANRPAELWRPDSGQISPATYSQDGDRSTVPLDLAPNETLFVVFRDAAASPTHDSTPTKPTKLADISGEWKVTFPPNRGAPDHITLPTLESWTNHKLPGVEYFSGTASYTIDVDAPADWFQPGRRLLVDLGDVRDLAEINLNGQPLGILWKPPYRVDATATLHAGANQLEVRVTNEWTNRIAGDRAAPPAERVLSDVQPGFGPPRPPEPSGLLGPVQILAE